MVKKFVSRDYIEFLENKAINLSDWDRATLIFKNERMTYEEKTVALQKIVSQTDDAQLKRQILHRLHENERLLENFKKATNGVYFQLSFCYDKYKGYEADGIYRSYDAAYAAYSHSREYDFQIKKEHYEDQVDVSDSIIGEMLFRGTDGAVMSFCLDQAWIGKGRWLGHVEERFVDLPLMFRQGDIVHIIGTEEYGIVASPGNDAEEEKMRGMGRQSNDFSDFQVVVDLIYRGDKFLSVLAHKHLPPTELEYARLDDGDTRKGVLEYMKKTLYNTSLWSSGGRDEGRIQEVLKKLETVWKQFPDLRLGQLLLGICAPYNLFVMEDEKLLELLQRNEFPIEE